jgi:hypothetical protein
LHTIFYDGGDASGINGSTTVNIEGETQIGGNVFGGGNQADVGGSTQVNIM